ncbi:cation diffusion facilitator family transporter [Methanoculleus frigidifontis]|nr:cation diffusion facilitator family transporter [Methanoculleus sp. FWC-SCC1]
MKRTRRSGTRADGPVAWDERIRCVSRALVVSMLIGTLLGGVEVGLFAVTGNRALLTDGFVNIISLIPGTLSLISVRLGQRQADWKMHYGYRRIETLMVLFFALAVCGFALNQIVDTLLCPPENLVPEYGIFIAGYAVAAIAIEILLSRHLWRVGKETNSRLLLLDAVLIRGDIAISAIILAGGVLLIVFPSMALLQTAVTLVVVLIIFAYGAKEGVIAARELIDANPSFQANALIERIVEENPPVFFIAEQRIRSFGGALSVELTLEVDPGATVQEAYALSQEIESRIRSEIENVIDIRIRAHPSGAFVEAELGNNGTERCHDTGT